MFGALFLTPIAKTVIASLDSVEDGGPTVVLGPVRFARALAGEREVIAVADRARALRRAEGVPGLSGARGEPEAVPVDDGAAAALVAFHLGLQPAWEELFAEWSRAVRDGGAIVLVEKGQAVELSRRALCAGLSEIEQRYVGRTVVTSGLVSKLRSAADAS